MSDASASVPADASVKKSMAASYSPTMVPKGPEMRWSSSWMLSSGGSKRAAGLAKGSGMPNRDKVGKLTRAQLAEIVKTKQQDLNALDPVRAARMVEGTARSMGVEVVD